MQPQNMQIEPGAVVLARDGYIGTVEEVIPEPGSGQPGYIVTAPNQTGDRLLIPVGLIDPNSQPGEVYLREVFQTVLEHSQTVPVGVDPRILLTQPSGPAVNSGLPTQSRLVVPIIEEQLNVSKRTVELGAIELKKTIEQFTDSRRLPLTFDQLDVERVPVNRPLEAPLEPRYEGDVLIIPIMEEVLVVEKRLMLKEEVRIHKRQVIREQEINETLRREHVEVVSSNSGLVTVNDASQPAVAAAPEPQPAPGPVGFNEDQPTMQTPIVNNAVPYQPIGMDQPAPGLPVNPDRPI